jgi:hypothetical protein
MKTYIPKRLREIAEHPLGVTDVTDESPLLTPNVSNVSNVSGGRGVFPEKNGSEPEPQNLGTERPEPRDEGISLRTIPVSTPAVPRPLERLLENLKAVHAQLEHDQAKGFTVETIDLDRSSKVQVQGRNHQALERVVRQAQKRTPDAERVIVCAILPDGWEVVCAQFHDGTHTKRVQA